MALEEFLRRIDLGAWRPGQLVVGMVLPTTGRHQRADWSPRA